MRDAAKAATPAPSKPPSTPSKTMKNFRLLVLTSVLAWARYTYASEIHDAARGGDAVTVVSLVQAHPGSINRPDGTYGYTPLHVAVVHGHIDVVRALAVLGADLDVTARSGCSALKLAIGLGKDRIADLLASRGATVIEPPRVVVVPQAMPLVVPERPTVREAPVRAGNSRGGSYQHVGSQCEACGEAVPRHLGIGDRCPHCGVTWGGTRIKFLN